MDPLGTIAIVLLASFILKEVLGKLKVPVVVSQILSGIFLGIPLIKALLFDTNSLSFIEYLSMMGIVFLLFLAGLEINFKKIVSSARDTVLIASLSTLFPLMMGFAFMYYLFGDWLSSSGFNPFITSLIFGLSLSLTAEGTNVKVLLDLDKINTRVSAIMLGAGALDDVIEVLSLAFVLALIQSGGGTSLYWMPIDIAVFGLLTIVSLKVFSKVLRFVERTETDVEVFMVVLIMMFGIVEMSEVLNLGFLIGAIIGGFILQSVVRRKKNKTSRVKLEEEEILDGVKLIALAFLAPFFFVNIGLNFSISNLIVNPYLLIGTLTVAFMSKIIGALAVKPFTELGWRQLYVIGWGMNSRGAVELIIALTAFSHNLIPLEVFSVLVAASLATTLTFPFALQREISKNPHIMD